LRGSAHRTDIGVEREPPVIICQRAERPLSLPGCITERYPDDGELASACVATPRTGVATTSAAASPLGSAPKHWHHVVPARRPWLRPRRRGRTN